MWVFLVCRLRGDDKQMSKVLFLSIIAHHVPILGVLKPGVVSVFESDGNTKHYFGMLKMIGLTWG
jgi:hypothetical protein